MALIQLKQGVAPEFWEQAKDDLVKRDPVMHRLIKQFNDSMLCSHGDAFSTLVRAIVGQQISVKAAASTWQKLDQALSSVTPERVHNADISILRACGLSARKISYLKDLSWRFINDEYDKTAWQQMNDEALIARLIQIKGIGRWTAEMFLIFHMLRPDVLPVADIGLQRAVSFHYNDKQPLEKNKLEAIAMNWRPWRSVATWYLWRSLDTIAVDY